MVSPDTCRPFSKDRRGMILGEGSAMLVLEPLEAALASGARIHAEIVGFGMSSDACHITQPSPEGAARAMRAVLRDSGLAPEQIGYINAHGTATPANDPTETAAIRAVFGAHAAKLAVSSTKSMHGHALGAAAALECVAAVLALRDGGPASDRQLQRARPRLRPGRHPQLCSLRPGGVCDFEFVCFRWIERGAGAACGGIELGTVMATPETAPHLGLSIGALVPLPKPLRVLPISEQRRSDARGKAWLALPLFGVPMRYRLNTSGDGV